MVAADGPERAVAEAEHLGQLDRCAGDRQGAGALHDSVGTARLARLGPADLDDRAARRSGAEVGVEGDDTVHLRDRQVEHAGQHRHRCRIDVAQLVLDRVQGRHQPARDVGEPLRDLVDPRRQLEILHDESLDAGFSERLTAHDADCRWRVAPGRRRSVSLAIERDRALVNVLVAGGLIDTSTAERALEQAQRSASPVESVSLRLALPSGQVKDWLSAIVN